MDDLVTVAVPAVAAILGGVVTGAFGLLVQRGARRAEQGRWGLEAEERRNTRSYENRLRAYTDFLAEASNAMGYELNKIIERHEGSEAPSVLVDQAMRQDHPEFNREAVRRMTRSQGIVMMVATSEEVVSSSAALMDAVLKIATVGDVGLNWNERMSALIHAQGNAAARFREAAQTDLAR